MRAHRASDVHPDLGFVLFLVPFIPDAPLWMFMKPKYVTQARCQSYVLGMEETISSTSSNKCSTIWLFQYIEIITT